MKMTDEILGEMNVDGGDIEGEVEINGQKIYFGITVDEISGEKSAEELISEFKKFIADFDKWDKEIRAFAAKALTSACASPQRTCHPSPIILSRATTTAPTMGLGREVSKPLAANCRQRRINILSSVPFMWRRYDFSSRKGHQL